MTEGCWCRDEEEGKGSGGRSRGLDEARAGRAAGLELGLGEWDARSAGKGKLERCRSAARSSEDDGRGIRRIDALGSRRRTVIAYVDSSVLLRFVLLEEDPLREWPLITQAISSVLLHLECRRRLDKKTHTRPNA